MRQRVFAPLTQIAGNDALHRLATLHQGRKTALNHPIDVRMGHLGMNVHRCGQGVHHISQRGQLDDQNFHARWPLSAQAPQTTRLA